jgi:hypothetical protein
LTEKTDTVLPLKFAVARRLPSGLNATENGNDPVAKGEPVTWLSAPVDWLTENTDTVLVASFAVASRLPSGLNAIEVGFDPDPVANGEPETVEMPHELSEALLAPSPP